MNPKSTPVLCALLSAIVIVGLLVFGEKDSSTVSGSASAKARADAVESATGGPGVADAPLRSDWDEWNSLPDRFGRQTTSPTFLDLPGQLQELVLPNAEPEVFDSFDPVHRRIMAHSAHRIAAAASRGENARFPPYCFAEDTPRALVKALNGLRRGETASGSISGSGFEALATQIRGRWTRTATNASTGTTGDPLTLTWSIVPDGLLISGDEEGTSPSVLRSWFADRYPSEAVWMGLFQSVLDRWSETTGINFVHEPNDDSAPFGSSRGELGVRADIRIGGHPIDGPSRILAYAFFPNNGDIVIDTDDTSFDLPTNNSRLLRNTLGHEIGHALGLEHVCPDNRSKLMEPFLTTRFDGPQTDDIHTANRLYGDANEPNDSAAEAIGLGDSIAKLVRNLSIDDPGDVDFFSFVGPDIGGTITATVTPVGGNYLEGPQTETCDSGTAFNSRMQLDLALQILDSNGVSVLNTTDDTAAGFAETASEVALPPGGGPFYIRVSGAGPSTAQRYEIRYEIDFAMVPPTIHITDATVDEAAGVAELDVTLDGSDNGQLVTVIHTTLDDTAVTGVGGDYQGAFGVLFLSNVAPTTTVTIPINDDTLDEDDETFRVLLANPVNGAIADGEGIVTITDNDPTPTLTYTSLANRVGETDGGARFAFELDTPSGRDVTIDYTPMSGTATAGDDFEDRSGQVLIPPGSPGAELEVEIVDDAEAEPDETFAVAFSNPLNANATEQSFTIEILDDDASIQLVGSGMITRDPSGNIVLNWTAVPGRSYRVEESTDLKTWTTVPGAENLQPATVAGEFTDSRAVSGQRYYRIVDT